VATATLTLGDLTIEGVSRAGDETWFRIRPPGVAFDAGRGAEQMSGVTRLFLTHGHLDHALGLPYLLSLRGLQDLPAIAIHAPAAVCDPVRRFIEAAARLEGTRFHYEILPMEPGHRQVVGKDLTVEAFSTDHLVPSLGYHLVRHRKRLKAEFRDRSGDDLSRLRHRGVALEDRYEEIWLSYCGDTGPSVFELEPRLFEARVLLLECTFFNGATRESARVFKHLHLEDLVLRAGLFHNDDLVLHHASRRYTCGEMLSRVEERLILNDTQVHLFGC